MPITRRDPASRAGLTDSPSLLDQVNTHAFLFGDEDKQETSQQVESKAAKSRPVSYLHSNDEQGFPVLLRQQTSDLESSEPSSAQASKRSSFRRSLPPQAFTSQTSDDSPPYNYSSASSMMSTDHVTPTKSGGNRHSMGTSTYTVPGKRQSFASPSHADVGPPKLQSSYSANDVPTLGKATVNGAHGTPSTVQTPASNAVEQRMLQSNTSEQRLHQHNVSLGRIPAAGKPSNRHSRELSSGGVEIPQRDENNMFSVLQSPVKAALHTQSNGASAVTTAATSIPSYSTVAAPAATATPFSGNPVLYQQFSQPPTFGMQTVQHQQQANQPQQQQQALPAQQNNHTQQHQMNLLNNAMAGLNMNPPQTSFTPAATSQPLTQQHFITQYAQPQVVTTQFPGYTPNTRYQEPIPRATASSRRGTAHSEASDSSRFANVPLESIRGDILTLCKDQHGCRYLQKTLEDKNPEHLEMIFNETKGSMVDLMTGKLLPQVY